MAARLSLASGYPSPDARQTFCRRLLRELRAYPEFASVALTSRSLLVMGAWPARVQREAAAPGAGEGGDPVLMEYVSDGYFSTLGLRPLAGREFEPGEHERGRLTALVNESFSRRHFGRRDPLGQRIRIVREGAPAGSAWHTIVGVVPDTQMQGPFEPLSDGAGVILPIEEMMSAYPTVVVRGRARAGDLVESVRRAVARLDPDLSVYGASTPRERLRAVNGEARAIAALFAAFGAVSGVLAAIGLYGVTAFTVNARTREWGIRMALGAAAPQVMRIILREGARQFFLGTVGGIALTFALAQMGGAQIENFLQGVSPRDPSVYGAVVAILGLALALACWLPARRATKIDPMIALRSE